jgi:hypothetical protein
MRNLHANPTANLVFDPRVMLFAGVAQMRPPRWGSDAFGRLW